MIEYEYSFKVKDISPYIKYCSDNDYKKEKENFQTRELYTNSNQVLARVTTQITDEKEEVLINFKDQNETENVLKTSRETPALKITNENKEFFESMLNILQFDKYKTLKRKRYVYSKDGVIFEIDEYSAPEEMYVVAIEGEKSKVDEVYNEINSRYSMYLV